MTGDAGIPQDIGKISTYEPQLLLPEEVTPQLLITTSHNLLENFIPALDQGNEQDVRKIAESDYGGLCRSLCELAKVSYEVGENPESLLNEAVRIAQQVQFDRTGVVHQIAEAYAVLGDRDTVERLYSNTHPLTQEDENGRKIQFDINVVRSVKLKLAENLIRNNQVDEAIQLLTSSLPNRASTPLLVKLSGYVSGDSAQIISDAVIKNLEDLLEIVESSVKLTANLYNQAVFLVEQPNNIVSEILSDGVQKIVTNIQREKRRYPQEKPVYSDDVDALLYLAENCAVLGKKEDAEVLREIIQNDVQYPYTLQGNPEAQKEWVHKNTRYIDLALLKRYASEGNAEKAREIFSIYEHDPDFQEGGKKADERIDSLCRVLIAENKLDDAISLLSTVDVLSTRKYLSEIMFSLAVKGKVDKVLSLIDEKARSGSNYKQMRGLSLKIDVLLAAQLPEDALKLLKGRKVNTISDATEYVSMMSKIALALSHTSHTQSSS